MRLRTLMLLLLQVVVFCGCVKEKEIVRVLTDKTECYLSASAKPAPFSYDPNVYFHLNIPTNSFRSGQMDDVLIFVFQDGQIGCMFTDIDHKRVVVTSRQGMKPEVVSDMKEVRYALARVGRLSIGILGKNIVLNDVGALFFDWHSGGLYFYAFRDAQDGFRAAFDGDFAGIPRSGVSGFVRFSEWNRKIEDWPVANAILSNTVSFKSGRWFNNVSSNAFPLQAD